MQCQRAGFQPSLEIGRTLARVGRAHERSHGISSGHLLQHGDEEAHLDLGAALEERVEGGGPLGLAEDAEPLLDGGELFLEIDIEAGRSHFLERCLVVLQVFEPAVDGCSDETS